MRAADQYTPLWATYTTLEKKNSATFPQEKSALWMSVCKLNISSKKRKAELDAHTLHSLLSVEHYTLNFISEILPSELHKVAYIIIK